MRRIVPLTLLGLLALAASSRAGCPLPGCCPACKPIPCPECPDCSCPCERRPNLLLFDRSEELIAELQSCGGGGGGGGGGCGCGECGNCCDRIKAAEGLGNRFKADFCCNPNVLAALIGALQCDKCWEVRKAAAWSIMLQGARTEEAVLALYVSSKTDPHYMVRAEAAQALDILTVCRGACFKELYARADDLIKQLKAKGYKPGTDNCRVVFAEACASCGVLVGAGVEQPVPAPTAPAGPTAQPLPPGR
ncbi:MAG TPA: HEAT repeat domain-containing protein [Gemmataceae bacterium]|nr:HEAT repeat domain-containing protein [Gemmataceae bacterium]